MVTIDDERIKHFRDWLRDAHAMEQQAEALLKGVAGRLEHYPELKARIDAHILETQLQAQLLQQCMERVGVDNSSLKDLGGRMMASAQAFSGMFASDEVVKTTLFTYAFKHMEIASYRSLIAAAGAVGDAETAEICMHILQQEEAMAGWLDEQLPSITRQFLENVRLGQPAKR